MRKENNFDDLNDVFKSLAIIQAFIKRDMKALLDWLCESSGKWLFGKDIFITITILYLFIQ